MRVIANWRSLLERFPLSSQTVIPEHWREVPGCKVLVSLLRELEVFLSFLFLVLFFSVPFSCPLSLPTFVCSFPQWACLLVRNKVEPVRPICSGWFLATAERLIMAQLQEHRREKRILHCELGSHFSIQQLLFETFFQTKLNSHIVSREWIILFGPNFYMAIEVSVYMPKIKLKLKKN